MDGKRIHAHAGGIIYKDGIYYWYGENKEKKPKRKKLNNGNTAIADYVWLPIQFEGEKPTIRWYDEWRIEDFG